MLGRGDVNLGTIFVNDVIITSPLHPTAALSGSLVRTFFMYSPCYAGRNMYDVDSVVICLDVMVFILSSCRDRAWRFRVLW